MADLAVEVYRGGRSAIMGTPVASDQGDITFAASAGHASVIAYEVRVRVYQLGGGGTLVDAINIGKPTPVDGFITINIATELGALAAGNYTVSVAAIGPNGTDDSSESAPFSLPLA